MELDQMMNYRAMVLVIVVFGVALGCSRNEEAGGESKPAADTPASPAQAMEALGDALKAEAAVLHKAVHAVDTMTDEDRKSLWQALKSQEQPAQQIKAILDAGSTPAQSVCKHYQALVQKPYLEVTGLRKDLFARVHGSSVGGDWWRLLTSAAPSEDAARAHMTFMSECPGSPVNLQAMCQQSGHLNPE
jgi:hypothetical protein